MNMNRAVGHDSGRYLILLNTDRWIDRPTFQEQVHPTAETWSVQVSRQLGRGSSVRGCAVTARSWSSGSVVTDHNLRGCQSVHAQTPSKKTRRSRKAYHKELFCSPRWLGDYPPQLVLWLSNM